jgi:hypothetical protein
MAHLAQGEHDQELLHATKKTEDAIMNLNELKQECKQKETLIEEATQRSQEFEKEVSAKEVDLVSNYEGINFKPCSILICYTFLTWFINFPTRTRP